jgi:predicted DNA binding CopG/RHH family protein
LIILKHIFVVFVEGYTYAVPFVEQEDKVKRVNIRMTEQDVEKAQAIALREGIPYATLLTNILHRYLTGRLKDNHDTAC